MSSFAGARMRPLAILLLLLLLAHAPLLLNDGLVMDDWLNLQLRSAIPVDLAYVLHGAGHPIFYGYLALANLTGASVLVMKVLALVGIIAGAGCLFLAATCAGLLTPTEAVGCALIVWTYPGYRMWAGKSNSLYVFSLGLFFVGTWLLTLAYKAKGASHILLRLAAALVFLFSFELNSIMVLYAFAVLGLLVAVWRDNDGEKNPIRRAFLSAWRCATGYPELIVLPLLYWGALNFWFKRVGVYADYYNAHLPTLRELMDGWQAFFLTGYVSLLWDTARSILSSSIPFILAAALVTVGVLLVRFGSKHDDESKHSIALPLLLAPILFLALSLPYLIAGLRPAAENFYESRHLLMFGIPLALGILAVKRLTEVGLGAGAAFAAIFGIASILSIAMLWNGYIFMQARALKLESLLDHLASMPQPPATVFNIIDGFMDYPSPYSPAGGTEASNMLRLAWGNQPFFGFTLRAERPTVLQEMEVLRSAKGSAFHNVDPTGRQATISFQPGPAAAPNAVLVRHYYACRLLGRCDVSKFVMQIATVKIDVGPIAGVKPIDHPN